MFQLKSILAAPFMLAAFTAAPAMAQYYPGPPPGYVGPEFRVIPEPEIVRVLHSLGFRPIGRPRLQGRLWIVRALDEDEIPMRVVLDASTGEVIDAIAIGAGAPPPAPRYGMVPDDLDDPDYRNYPPAPRVHPREPGSRVIYRDRGFYDGELPPPPATIGPRPNLDKPASQARQDPALEQRTVVRPTDTGKRAAVPTPKPKPSEIAASAKNPIVTGSMPPKTEPLPPVNPLE